MLPSFIHLQFIIIITFSHFSLLHTSSLLHQFSRTDVGHFAIALETAWRPSLPLYHRTKQKIGYWINQPSSWINSICHKHFHNLCFLPHFLHYRKWPDNPTPPWHVLWQAWLFFMRFFLRALHLHSQDEDTLQGPSTSKV